MKGGLGSAFIREGALAVQAVVVCNAFGDVVDKTGKIVAGARVSPDSREFVDTSSVLASSGLEGKFLTRKEDNQNTVLCAVMTNARLEKDQCQKAATSAFQGISQAVRPASIAYDGDVVFLAATGQVGASAEQVGRLGGDCIAQAIVQGVCAAWGFGLVPEASVNE